VVPIVINFPRAQNVAVLVEGVSDGGVVSRIVRDVQRIFRHLVGGWQVAVRATDRGRWRLELSGVSGRHVWIFAAPAVALPTAVVEKLEAFLRDSWLAWQPLPAGV
jgi:hypothetical protein